MTTNPSPLASSEEVPDEIKLLTAEQAALIRESYAKKIEPNLNHNALIMFLTIFDIDDDIRDLFWFVRDMDEPAPTNPMLQKHATEVFRTICEAATKLESEESMEALRKELAFLQERHQKFGPLKKYEQVFRNGFLCSLRAALKQEWTPEMETAWSTAFTTFTALANL